MNAAEFEQRRLKFFENVAAAGLDPKNLRVGGERLQKKKKVRMSKLKKLIQLDQYEAAETERERLRNLYSVRDTPMFRPFSIHRADEQDTSSIADAEDAHPVESSNCNKLESLTLFPPVGQLQQTRSVDPFAFSFSIRELLEADADAAELLHSSGTEAEGDSGSAAGDKKTHHKGDPRVEENPVETATSGSLPSKALGVAASPVAERTATGAEKAKQGQKGSPTPNGLAMPSDQEWSDAFRAECRLLFEDIKEHSAVAGGHQDVGNTEKEIKPGSLSSSAADTHEGSSAVAASQQGVVAHQRRYKTLQLPSWALQLGGQSRPLAGSTTPGDETSTVTAALPPEQTPPPREWEWVQEAYADMFHLPLQDQTSSGNRPTGGKGSKAAAASSAGTSSSSKAPSTSQPPPATIWNHQPFFEYRLHRNDKNFYTTGDKPHLEGGNNLPGKGNKSHFAASSSSSAPAPPATSNYHSNNILRIRHYVHALISEDLNEKVKNMLLQLNMYQERVKESNPMKFAKQKRLVLGLREIARALKREKLLGMIVAPDLESSARGLDQTVEDMMEQCRSQNLPIVFALTRRSLGFTLKRLRDSNGVAAVGLLSVEGQNREWRAICKQSEELRAAWVMQQMGGGGGIM
ncbi:unnamed protein product [Amoebophrya sp. A120]|nr:unnamed protein product [Amoebophrya sp. A120]|eukprot:GSA120T00016897001.1